MTYTLFDVMMAVTGGTLLVTLVAVVLAKIFTDKDHDDLLTYIGIALFLTVIIFLKGSGRC